MAQWENLWDDGLLIRIILLLFNIYFVYCLIVTSNAQVRKSGFFKCFIHTSILDIILVLALEFINMDVRVGTGWLRVRMISSAITGSNMQTHMLGCLLMTASQFTSLYVPLKHEYIWSSRKTSLYLFIVTIAAFGAYVNVSLMDGAVVEDPSRPGYCKIVPHNNRRTDVNRLISTVTVLVCQSISVWMIIMIIYRIKQVKTQLSSNNRSYIIFNILASGFSMVFVAVELMELFDLQDGFSRFIYRQYPLWIIPIAVMMNGPMIVSISSVARYVILSRWSKSFKSKQVSVVDVS